MTARIPTLPDRGQLLLIYLSDDSLNITSQPVLMAVLKGSDA